MRHRMLFCLLLASCALAPSAHADVYQFTFSSTLNPSQGDFSFQLPSSPVPAYVDPQAGYLDTAVVPITAGGTTFLSFTQWTSSGFSFDSGDYALTGATLFTGPLSGPTFTLGSYGMMESYEASPRQDAGTLVISDITAATPEPSSWLLLATGLTGIGAVFARRRVAGIAR